ncbi:MAG TPA: aspartyl protease family protein [Polyangia bacterium]|nr:aspartyl protease family protein [Polyangia bacterium]
MKTRLSMLAAAVAIVSCGDGGDSKYATTGSLGIPSSAVVGANLVFAAASVNGSPSTEPAEFGVLIDTGSPVVLIEPGLFGLPAPATADDVQTHIDLGFLKDGDTVVTIKKVPALQLSAAMMDEIGFGGILGGNVMRDFSIQLDYAAPMMTGFCLGCISQARDDVDSPGAAIPFTLRGGGRGPVPLTSTVQPTVSIPSTRVPVTVEIDGTSYPFILDTGASEVSVRTSVFDALTADGRSKLMGFPITTVMGDSGASVTRARSVTVGGESVANVPVMTIPGDDLLDGISKELDGSGRTQIDGLLGGSFLRNFLVTIDYPKGQLHLQRYATQTWQDEFQRVGIGLAQTPPHSLHTYAVGNIYAGTDASKKGLRVGTEIWSVDGKPLDALDPIEADATLDGTPGTSKTLEIANADDAATPMTVEVLVDDLIPAPPPAP